MINNHFDFQLALTQYTQLPPLPPPTYFHHSVSGGQVQLVRIFWEWRDSTPKNEVYIQRCIPDAPRTQFYRRRQQVDQETHVATVTHCCLAGLLHRPQYQPPTLIAILEALDQAT